ncbi:MAG: 30S ribosome-binding factor RbfA [Clostridiales bacterium]|nr:30S ribosome-binding factor RbfA [Clostridiales bacterium]
MAHNRIDRINEEVHRALSDAMRTLKDPRIQGLVSITRCDVTGDLRFCKVHISFLGTDEDQKNVIKGLKSALGYLRREISQRVNLRYTPELIIVPDDSISNGVRISGILHSLNEKERSSDDK